MKQFLIALDQLFNTLIYVAKDGFGFADETLSARSWRLREQSSLYVWIDRLFGENHCKESYESEVLRKHLPSEYR